MTDLVMGHPPHPSRTAAAWRALRGIWAMWKQRQYEAEAAAELMSFSDRALADVGIGRCEITARVRYSANHSQPSDN